MGQEFDNNMRGVLFDNDRKEKETHPDLKGSCEINGVEYWVSAWEKQGKKGAFLSLSFEAKSDNPGKGPGKPVQQKEKRWGKPAAEQQQSFEEEEDPEVPF